MREAYRFVERSEAGGDGSSFESDFPFVPAAAPDLDRAEGFDSLTEGDRERLHAAFSSLSADDLDADALGEALARLSTTPFVRHEAVRASEATRVRDAGGTFFTPRALVERTLDLALEPLLDERLKGKPPADQEAALLDLCVVDPACGSGRFLLAAATRIATRIAHARREGGDANAGEETARAEVVERCLWGVDLDPLAIEALRFRLRRELRKAGRASTSIARRTICGDATVDVDWRRMLSAETRQSDGFDIVLGNPPWISYSGRHRGTASAHMVARLVERYPEIASWPAMHSANLALATRLVRRGGRIGFVLPLRMADLDAYAELRAQATRRLEIEHVIDAGEEAFVEVVQPAGLFVFRAVEVATVGSRKAWNIESQADPTRFARVINHSDEKRIEEALVELSRRTKFPPRTFGDPGVHTGNIAAKLLSLEPTADEPLIREGRDVTAYACQAPRRGLRLAAELGPGEYCRIGKLTRYFETPILLRQTADRPIAARHVERTYFRNSLLACAGVPGVPDEFVVAFLNSALYALLHRRGSGDAKQRTFPQMKVSALQRLPRPPFDAAEDSSDKRSLLNELTERTARAEREASTSTGLDDDLAIAIERLVLRSFGLDERLAPLLIARTRKARPERASQ